MLILHDRKQKKIKTKIIFEDRKIMAFQDINPQAPVHFLLIPKLHFSTLNDLLYKDKKLVGHLIYSAAKLAKIEGIADQGYELYLIVMTGVARQFTIYIYIY